MPAFAGVVGNEMLNQCLQGKSAIITGAASGIGRATALLFAREGASVSLADVNEAGGIQVEREISSAGGLAHFECVDVTQAADCRRIVERALDRFEGVSILFNNAGIIRRASVLELNEEDWDRVMEVNVKSIFLMARHAIPIMARFCGGLVFKTPSGLGVAGGAQTAAYCASQGGVVLLAQGMAVGHRTLNILA